MLKYLLAVPFAAVLAAFALSNPEPVRIGLWPTDLSVELPLSIAILGFSAVSFFTGALITWLPGIAARNRARVTERKLRELQARLDAAGAPPPAPSPMRRLLGGPSGASTSTPGGTGSLGIGGGK